MRTLLAWVALLLPAIALGDPPAAPRRATDVAVWRGTSLLNEHGRSTFVTASILRERPAGRALSKHVSGIAAGWAAAYSTVVQAHSWFGYRDGEGNDRIRAYSANWFLRRYWRVGSELQPFVEGGTGPMFSNRRIPAATSRLNFESHLTAGFATSGGLVLAYRFAHISNGGTASRNPGLEVHAITAGFRFVR